MALAICYFGFPTLPPMGSISDYILDSYVSTRVLSYLFAIYVVL